MTQPPEPKSPTILAVGAHHDDNELFAGTLAAHRRAGWNVVSVVVTNGCYIDGQVSPQHVTRREAESRRAAQLLDMEYEFLRVAEGTLVTTEAHIKMVISVLRRWQPGIVVTHPPIDYHREHEWVSRLTADAVASCWNPSIETGEPPASSPVLYFCDAWFVPFEPDEYVDVTEFMDLKRQMLQCHKSQLVSSRPDAENMVELAILRSRQRGFEAGVKYAEAFRLAPRLGQQRLSSLLHGPCAAAPPGRVDPQTSTVPK